MAPLSIQSGVKYAKALLPETLVRSVSTVQTTISRHILPSAQPRCFNVCTQSRRRRRGVVASSVDELLEQAARVFVLSCHFLTLVLEEDGTVVDSEDFFQSLPNNTPLMVLEKGEMWTQNKILPSFRQPKRNGIAKLTFDLYKLHPKDFLCCLSIKATLYELHTLSYNFRCTTMKHVLRSVLRCFTYLTRLAGQLLLYTSSSLLQFTGEDDCC
ncbi:cell death activator CIDE-A [Toxotes jaculatrix]|uniref:cell death activator CIDE-A n=1 Tax=Toxotes jaculatrix TaxID=941984 RepID=UPI001B3ACE58|nr:cell death activator CIDE-A [Toxotes jaculatrix]